MEGVRLFPLNPPHVPSEEVLSSDVIILNIPPFEGQLSWFETWNWKKKTHLIFVSSTSVISQENILKQEEAWVEKNFVTFTILRFGGLFGPNRHPGRSLSGKKNVKGKLHPVNLLHLNDAVGFTMKVIEKGLTGTFHVVASEHPQKKEFYTAYCLKEGIPLPEFDETDESTGKIVPNDEARKHYEFRRIEKSL